MRTKTLILSAAFGVAGMASAMAQVYSVNAVGYINLEVAPGFSMIANQLDNGNDNMVADLIPAPAVGTAIYKFNGAGYDIANFLGAWIGADTMTLAPGEGVFINNPEAEAFTVTLVGEVPQGDLSTAVPAGFSILSSQVPQAGAVQTVLGLTPTVGDSVYQYNGAGYDIANFLGAWVPAEPTIAVGESFFYNAQAAGSWDRTFSVND